jgi:hypothetical protein
VLVELVIRVCNLLREVVPSLEGGRGAGGGGGGEGGHEHQDHRKEKVCEMPKKLWPQQRRICDA